MCSKVSEKSKRAPKGVMCSVKLDVIKGSDRGEQNKDNGHALNFPASAKVLSF